MVDSILFSSEKDTWETPDALFFDLDEIFNFTFDVCATIDNTKCSSFWSPEDDALSRPWVFDGPAWMNPPYGGKKGSKAGIDAWVRKAYEAGIVGETVVALIPARTETRYFQNYCFKAAELFFLKGRLRFKGGEHSAPFPSALVVFSPDEWPEAREFVVGSGLGSSMNG